MVDDIKIDLTEAAPLNKKAKPTMAERLYAERLAAGLHENPDPATITQGVVAAMAIIDSAKVEPEQADMPNGRDLVNQLLGQIQMANSFARFADVVSLQKLKYIKDNKVYRSVAGVSMVSAFDGEKIADVGTWGGFCKALGLSVSKVDEDLLNLSVFGEEALKQLSSIGAGYRELRQYRKLPADDKTALIEAAKAGDKEQLLDLAETLIERHVQEKTALNAKVNDLEQDINSTGKRISNMNAEIERAESELSRLKAKQRLTNFEEQTEAVRDECMHLQFGCTLNLDSLEKLFTDSFYGEQTPEQQLRIEQVYIAIKAAASHAFVLLETVQELMLNSEMRVDRIQGQHILTPEEAERWLLDAQMLESKSEAEKLARDVKREAARPKGRGRPSGSKNKAAE